MSYELEGIMHKVFPTEQRTDNFSTRDFVVLIPGEYPQHIKFQLSNANCNLVNNIPEGTGVRVSFNLRGKEWQEDKYILNAVAWKVEPMTGRSNSGPVKAEKPSETFTDAEIVDEDKPLPF